MTEYTPGPWTIGLYRRPDGRLEHCTYLLLNVRVDAREEADANARLIASAPDLRAALKIARTHLRTDDIEWTTVCTDLELMDRALRDTEPEGEE